MENNENHQLELPKILPLNHTAQTMSFIFNERPSPSPLIESIWRTESHQDGSFISSASTQCQLVVTKYQGNTTVTLRGPETQATHADFPADAEFLGITFALGTFLPHLPTKQIMDRRDLTLPEATANAIWLQGTAWEVPTFENMDVFVKRLVRKGMVAHEPVVDATIQGYSPDLSLRAVQYRFLHATGLTYNTVRQIERAHQAVALLEQGASILDTVYEAGYFDQAHLTRSLKRFMGQTPTQFLRLRQAA